MEFPEGIESLGKGDLSSDSWNRIFEGSGVEEVTLPSTLRHMSLHIFDGCCALRTVWMRDGCLVDVENFVGRNVRVLWKGL